MLKTTNILFAIVVTQSVCCHNPDTAQCLIKAHSLKSTFTTHQPSDNNFCDDVARLIEEAPNGFEALKAGKKVKRAEDYEYLDEDYTYNSSKIVLSPATEGFIDSDICSFTLYEGQDSLVAYRIYDNFQSKLKECMITSEWGISNSPIKDRTTDEVTGQFFTIAELPFGQGVETNSCWKSIELKVWDLDNEYLVGLSFQYYRYCD